MKNIKDKYYVKLILSSSRDTSASSFSYFSKSKSMSYFLLRSFFVLCKEVI